MDVSLRVEQRVVPYSLLSEQWWVSVNHHPLHKERFLGRSEEITNLGL